MEKANGRRNIFLYHMLHTVLFTAAVVLCFAHVCGIGTVTWLHGFVMLAVILVLGSIQYMQGKMRLYAGMIFFFCFLGIFLIAGVKESIDFVKEYFGWLFSLGNYQPERIVFYQVLQVVWISAAGYVLQLFTEKYFFLKKLSGAVLGIWLLYEMTECQPVSHMGVACTLTYVAVIFTEGVQQSCKKERRSSRQMYMLWLTPFLALYLILLSFMPAPRAPYGWQWAKNLYSRLEEKLTIFTENVLGDKKEDFNFHTSGFSEDGRLFDSVWEKDTRVLTLTCKSGLLQNIYISGRSFDTFDGREWQVSLTEAQPDWIYDTLELVYAAERYAPGGLSDYIKSTGMQVRYEYFHTRCLFAPIKAWNVEGIKQKLSFSQEGSNPVFEEQQGYGMEYRLNFYQMNAGHPVFWQLVQSESAEDEAVWKKTVKEMGLDSSEYSLEKLLAYRQAVEDWYGQKVELSKEAEEWLLEITKDAKTDLEKLVCIEEALRDFSYTVNPGPLPDEITNEQEFLDYFLLESRQGYCAYFATAFVLLARAEGIPARYVQGFCVPVTNKEEIPVTSDMAHAWPEVYIEGIGFIPFEPTPGFEDGCRLMWNIRAEENTADLTDAEEEEEVVSGDEETGAIRPEATPAEEPPKEKNGRPGLFMAAVILIVLSGIALILAADGMRERYRGKKRSVAEQFAIGVLRNLQILALLGCERKEGETYQEMQHRAKERFGKDACSFTFIEMYEEVLYGSKMPDKEMLESVKAEREQLLLLVRKYKKRTYVWCRVKLYLTRIR